MTLLPSRPCVNVTKRTIVAKYNQKRIIPENLKHRVYRYAGIIRFLIIGIICATLIFWGIKHTTSQLPQSTEIEHAEIQTAEKTLPAQAVENRETPQTQSQIEQSLFALVSFPENDNIPDINSVTHITAISKLKNFIPYEEELPHNILEDHTPDIKPHPQDNRPRIVIVIDDMGASPMRTKDINKLKAPLTASFLTFAPNLKKQVKASQAAGHEIMLHVPMQPQSKIYVSEDVLTIDMDEEKIAKQFQTMLKKVPDIKGINNHMGSKFTEYADKLSPVMKILAQHNMFFLDSKTTPHSQVKAVAEQYQVPCLSRHVFLDNNNDFQYITGQLQHTEKLAQKNGYAIAIGHPKSQTYLALKAWLPTLREKKIRLVHLSELLPSKKEPE